MSFLPFAIFSAFAVLAGMYLYVAASVSWNISKSDYFEPNQKIAQHFIVWVFPILGAAFVVHVLSLEQKWRRPGWIPVLDYLILSAFVSSNVTAQEQGAEGLEAHAASDNAPEGDSSN